ncbi:FMN-binding negative transcriptional regulator [Zavarzinella formosa]|uniref:FMN-binding negative transcriptional regulator n=1 Tax=Zavarzinella formosa TaxID=360055 RepID=UPI00030FDF72|nr:FMN-binding negative transcriptional regulator [Zavarzinella formosa]
MYIPPAFVESDLGKLHDHITKHSFGLLISQADGQPFATHVPFLLDRAAGPNGALVGHVARANPHWRSLAGETALAVFSGPHAYISPTWYEAENTVPTWNYSAVHAYGRVEIIEDSATLLGIVQETVRVYEQNMPKPWTFDGSAVFVERLLAQIVGFRIVIDRIEGKWKLNQNHPAERREKVIRALDGQGDENSQGIADLMRNTKGMS